MSGPPTDLSHTLQNALGPQYRLERELGRGGMGVVYLATDLALQRTVAVKVISPELALNRALADRFISEARLIARLRHPNIVTVYAAGAADGLLYYVMDHVPGESLRDLLQREGRLDPDLVSRVVADIADALDTAARAGVVHRDIKPENILIERSGSSPRALLADFGIAHAVAGEGNLTGPGVAMGTPAYMSPEQASGETVDARSDLYSLGVVAFEMLVGRPPFEGPRRAVISRQIVDPPPSIARLRPEAPALLVGAIERALEKVPEQRWQTGAEFQRALLGLAPVRPRRRWRRRWRRPALAAVVAGAVLAATAWGLLRPVGPPSGVNPRHSVLIIPFGNLRDDATLGWLTPGSVSMLDLALSQWRELRVVGQERVRDLLGNAGLVEGRQVGLEQARRLAREAGVWTVVLGEFERTRDSLHLVARAFDVETGARLELAEAWGHLGDDVRPLFDELAAKLLDLSGAPAAFRAPLTAVTSSSLEAYRAYLRGLEHLNQWELAEAASFFEEAIIIDSSFSLAFYRLALTRGWMNASRDSLSDRYLAEATRFADRLPRREQQMIAAYRSFTQGDFPRAEALYGELIAMDSTDADAWYGLGDAWFHDYSREDRASALTRSLQAFQRALQLDPRYGLAYEHVNNMLTGAASISPYYALLPGDRFARARSRGGEPAMAPAALSAAVTRAREAAVASARAWTEYQPSTVRAHRALLEAHLSAGDAPAALADVARIRALYPEAARPLAGFLEARVRLVMGEPASATGVLREALDALDPLAVSGAQPGHEVVMDVLSGANAFAYLGDLAGAEAVIQAADQVRRLLVPSGAVTDAYGDDRVWQSGRLSALYSAVGAPPFELRELWRRVSRVAQGATPAERPYLAWAGASAAQGLLVGEAADATALGELQTLTGVQPRAEFRALAAVVRGDSSGARSALGARDQPAAPKTHEQAMEFSQAAAFAMGDPRPVEAEVQYHLGNYRATLDLLQAFEPDHLGTRVFDARWGLLARVRLLRGMAYEKLGRATEASREYQLVVSQWEAADDRLLPVVEAARAGMARIRGAKG